MQPARLSPESLLYIYYLKGRIAKDENIVNKNYLGTWEEDGFSFVFFLEPAKEFIEALLVRQSGLTLLDTFEMSYEQWQGGSIEPRQVGGFLLYPPWFTPPEQEPSTVITLDPGVVFGNGLHPTTQDCLQAIEIACAGGKVSSMLDLGTGTGVLAIAAVKRGCLRAAAVDFNFLACRTAHHNVILNNVEKHVVVINSQAEPFTAIPTDLLVANIHYDVMRHIIASKGFLRQKWFVLSGLLTSEARRVEETLAGLPVLVLRRWSRDGTWHTILGITGK